MDAEVHKQVCWWVNEGREGQTEGCPAEGMEGWKDI